MFLHIFTKHFDYFQRTFYVKIISVREQHMSQLVRFEIRQFQKLRSSLSFIKTLDQRWLQKSGNSDQ